MYEFHVLDVEDPRWSLIVNSSFMYDFHHTSFYHKIDNIHRSLLFCAKYEDDFIAIPLVVRPIESTGLFDATSVYGYAGPISNKPGISDLGNNLLIYFKRNFDLYCRDNNIICIFSRLHPLIDQKVIFSDFGDISDLNSTIAIDLRLLPEDQKSQYRKSNKSEINQLKKRGFSIVEAKSESEIDIFIAIYYETMDRVAAPAYYYFTRDYFYSFLKNDSFRSKLLLARVNDEVVAGAIFTYTHKIMQYHLAGTIGDYIKDAPMKLILDEARLSGNELGLEFLHLGGGVGGSDQDSLFRFKAGFSHLHCQYSVWKYIIDPSKYMQLVIDSGNVGVESSFFPLYRLNS